MDQVACTGSETHLFDCRHNGWGVHYCSHYEDVSISCYYYGATTTAAGGITAIYYGNVIVMILSEYAVHTRPSFSCSKFIRDKLFCPFDQAFIIPMYSTRMNEPIVKQSVKNCLLYK